MDITHLAIPTNISSRGPLAAIASDSGFGLYTGTDMKPGEVRQGEVMIVNIGLADGKVRLYERHVTSNFAAAELTLTVDEFNGSEVRLYEGAIGGLPSAGIPLGLYMAGEERSYRFIATLAEDTERRERRGAVAAYAWTADRAP